MSPKNCDLMIKARYILPIDKAMNIIRNGLVFVSGKNIIDIGEERKLSGKYKPEKIIDGGNGIVMPAMINTHTHAAMSYFRGLADDLPLNTWLNKHIWPAEAKYVSPDFVKKSSQLAILEMIKAGIACFNDMYFFAEITANMANAAGIRVCLGEGIIDFPTPSCANPDEAIKKTEELYNNYKNNELINIFAGPHSIYTCGRELLKQVRDTAHRLDIPIHIHISETKKEVNDCREKYKKTPVEYLENLGLFENSVIAAHSVWLSNNDLGIYEKRKIKVSHNPISNMKLASGIAPVPEMLNKGVKVGLGTDGAASNNTLDLFSEMRAGALLHKVNKFDSGVLNAREAVRMATLGGAEVLGLENRIGSLETGKEADIIMINLDKPHLTPIYDPYSHLVYCAGPTDVENVIIAGKIIMRDRQVKTMDEEKIIKESKTFCESIRVKSA